MCVLSCVAFTLRLRDVLFWLYKHIYLQVWWDIVVCRQSHMCTIVQSYPSDLREREREGYQIVEHLKCTWWWFQVSVAFFCVVCASHALFELRTPKSTCIFWWEEYSISFCAFVIFQCEAWLTTIIPQHQHKPFPLPTRHKANRLLQRGGLSWARVYYRSLNFELYNTVVV